MIFSCTTFVIQRTGKFCVNAAPRPGEIRPCPWCWGPTSRTPPRWPTAPGWPPPTSCSPPWCPPSSCAPPAASAGPPSCCTGRLACSWPGAAAAREAGRELREGHQPRRSEAVKIVINIIIISFYSPYLVLLPGCVLLLPLLPGGVLGPVLGVLLVVLRVVALLRGVRGTRAAVLTAAACTCRE